MIFVAGADPVFGGLLILVGLLTRPAASLMSGLMAAAYFMAHASGRLLPIVNGGSFAAIYSFLYLYFTVPVAVLGVWML